MSREAPSAELGNQSGQVVVDHTREGSMCFAKALLNAMHSSQNGFFVYGKHLDLFFLSDFDHRISGLTARPYLQDKLRLQLYGYLQPHREPLLFSFFSQSCLSRLSRQVGKNLVIYRLVFDAVIPYCDFRLPASQRRPSAGVIFGCGKPAERFLRLENLETLDARFNYQVRSGYFPFVTDKGLPGTWNSQTGNELSSAMEKTLQSGSFVPSLDIQQTLPILRDPSDFLDGRRLDIPGLLWKRWKQSVLIVFFDGTFISESLQARKEYQSKRKIFQPSYWKFSVLCYVGSGSVLVSSPQSIAELKDLDTSVVLCIWGSGLCTVLADEYATEVRKSFRRTEGTGERLANSKLRTFRAPSKARITSRLSALASKKSARIRRLNAMKKWCHCSICAGSTRYDDNMSKAGPEKLIATSYSLEQLLKILGLWKDRDTEILLDRVCELSVASMDIESRTVQLDLTEPGPGPGISYADIDVAALESHSRFFQLPVMLAHMDGLSSAGNPEGIFSVADDSEKAVRDMMKDYLAWLLQSQRKCSQEKLKLLEPLLTVVQAYRDAYFDYCQTWRQQNRRDFEAEDKSIRGKHGKRSKQPPTMSKVNDGNNVQPSSGPSCSPSWNWDEFLVKQDLTTAGYQKQHRGGAARQSDQEEEVDDDDDDDDDDNEDDSQACTSDSGSSSATVNSHTELLWESSMEVLVKSRPRCLLEPQHLRFLRAPGSEAEGGPGAKKRGRKHKVSDHFEDLVNRAWKHTLPGQLERALQRLISDYSVFSFYG